MRTSAVVLPAQGQPVSTIFFIFSAAIIKLMGLVLVSIVFCIIIQSEIKKKDANIRNFALNTKSNVSFFLFSEIVSVLFCVFSCFY